VDKPCRSPTPTLDPRLDPRNAPPLNLIPIPAPSPPLPFWEDPQSPHDFSFASIPTLCWLATLCRASYAPTSTFMNQAVYAALPQATPVTFLPNTGGLTPGYTTIVLPGGGIVVVSGTTSTAQALEQAYSASFAFTNVATPQLEDKGQVNVAYLNAANAILPTLSVLFPAGKPLLFCGHSYGAAVASVLAYKWSYNLGLRFGRTCSFAAPKVGNQTFADFFGLRSRDVKRLSISGDFVPALPPDLGLLRFAVPPPLMVVAANWARFRQLGQGNIVSSIGTVTASDDQTWPNLLAQNMLLAAAGQPLSLLPSHSIVTFVNYLRAGFTGWPSDFATGWQNAASLDAVNAGMTAAGL
jgi:pimeloyl-ACP methyl ester carboxylesterase